MQINSIQPNNKLNFKGAYLIQVEKQGFINPDNLKEVRDTFTHALRANTKEVPPLIAKFLACCGLGEKAIKTVSFLEQINYVHMVESLREHPNSATIKGPIDDRYHSFYVYTKTLKDRAILALTPYQREKIRLGVTNEEYRRQMETGTSYDYTTIKAKSNQRFMQILDTLRGNKPLKTFKIKSLWDLPEVVTKMDY